MLNPGPYLREKFPYIYYFLTAIIEGLRKVIRPYSIYMTDSLGGSFKEYILSSDLKSRIVDLKNNLDNESINTVDVIIQRLVNYPDERYRHKLSKHLEIAGGLLPVETEQTRRNINDRLPDIRRKLKLKGRFIEESSFFFYHGLSLLPSSAVKYIRNHDFIDAGAFIGDSAIALRDYNYKKIYSIEISGKSIERYKTNMADCNISSDKYEIIHAGLVSDNSIKSAIFSDTGSAGLSLLRKSWKYDLIEVKLRTLDDIADEYKITPRFIKADIEGYSLEFIKGARKTLIKNRPVLSIAIYHNPFEFFEAKPLLETFLKNYVFLVRKLTSGIKYNKCHSDVFLICCPDEIFVESL